MERKASSGSLGSPGFARLERLAELSEAFPLSDCSGAAAVTDDVPLDGEFVADDPFEGDEGLADADFVAATGGFVFVLAHAHTNRLTKIQNPFFIFFTL